MEHGQKNDVIEKQAKRILRLEEELQQVKEERDDLFRKFTELSLTVAAGTAYDETRLVSIDSFLAIDKERHCALVSFGV